MKNKNIDIFEEYICINDLVCLFDLKKNTVYRYCHKIEHLKIFGKIYFKKSNIIEFFFACRTPKFTKKDIQKNTWEWEAFCQNVLPMNDLIHHLNLKKSTIYRHHHLQTFPYYRFLGKTFYFIPEISKIFDKNDSRKSRKII